MTGPDSGGEGLPPICADCEDHGDGSYTCDPERPACRYRIRPYDDVNPASTVPDNAGPWRIGTHYGIHVYEGDRPVATFHREEDARRCVEALAERDELAAKVAAVRTAVREASNCGAVHAVRRALGDPT